MYPSQSNGNVLKVPFISSHVMPETFGISLDEGYMHEGSKTSAPGVGFLALNDYMVAKAPISSKKEGVYEDFTLSTLAGMTVDDLNWLLFDKTASRSPSLVVYNETSAFPYIETDIIVNYDSTKETQEVYTYVDGAGNTVTVKAMVPVFSMMPDSLVAYKIAHRILGMRFKGTNKMVTITVEELDDYL